MFQGNPFISNQASVPYYGNFNQQQAYNFNPQSQQQAQPNFTAQQSMQPQTNKIFVTSVDDALARPTMFNSEIVYLHQDQPLLIEIRTDSQGKKTPIVYDIQPHKEPEPTPQPIVDYVKREEYDELYAQIKEIRGTIQDMAKRRITDESVEQ